MPSRRTLAVLLLASLVASAALAQEFGSASGGQLQLLPKSAAKRSGSLRLTNGNWMKGYEATLGGTLLQDRLWFFGSASLTDIPGSRFTPIQGAATAKDIDAKFDAQLASNQNLAAAIGTGRVAQPELDGSMPSSFLSLRYDAILSPNALFSASVSRSSTTQP